jgi:AcrR family transcriptional regulator
VAKGRQRAPAQPKSSRKAGGALRKSGLSPSPAAKSSPASTPAARNPARARKVAPEARRQAILKAALTVFAAHGFEAARLDDVAQRAGVAKGTLYLYFRDKGALFEALVRNAVSPLLEQMSRIAAAPDIPPLQAIETFFALFEKEVLGTDRKLLLRLIMAEGPRFPAIAEFYYREVVSRGLAMMRALAKRAASEGAFATDAPARYPQLVVAPLLVAVIWDGLFANIDPLDVGALLRAHREVLTGKAERLRMKGAP